MNTNNRRWHPKDDRMEMFIPCKDQGGRPEGYFEDEGKVYRVEISKGKTSDYRGRAIVFWVTIQETTLEPLKETRMSRWNRSLDRSGNRSGNRSRSGKA